VTVAAFMDLALYDPAVGYYARAAKRTGRAGDFFTSVDVGPLFGELLEIQIAEMADLLTADCRLPPADFDLVEAGASNAQLSTDILRASRRRDPALYDRMRLHLVEASAHARAAGRATLGEVAGRLVSSSDALPPAFTGVLLANELLDALPVHQVVMRPEGLREVYVTRSTQPALTTCEAPPSTPALAEYLDRLGVTLEPGWRAEINLRALDWLREAAHRLTRGFIVVIDYGHEARELYSEGHSQGTLTTFARHAAGGPTRGATPSWLERPGEQDITAHVDFTSIRAAAEENGLTTLGFLDQTYFLMGLIEKRGQASFSERDSGALKTLLMPGGLGSTHKVLILGKNVGTPALCGCSYRVRVT
jgi:SAM-dependent MidA family methyltransferase